MEQTTKTNFLLGEEKGVKALLKLAHPHDDRYAGLGSV